MQLVMAFTSAAARLKQSVGVTHSLRLFWRLQAAVTQTGGGGGWGGLADASALSVNPGL